MNKHKKHLTILMVLLLSISAINVVLAESGSSDSDDTGTQSGSPGKKIRLADKSRITDDAKVSAAKESMLKQVKGLKDEKRELKAAVISLKEVTKDEARRYFEGRRDIRETKREQNRIDKEKLIRLIDQRKKEYKDLKDEYKVNKDELKKCKNVNTPECNDRRAKSLDQVKAYLIKGIELAIDHLDKLAIKVKGSAQFSEEDANAILIRIGDAKIKLTGYETQIRGANDIETLKKIAHDLREEWGKYRGYGHYITNKIANHANVATAFGMDNLLATLKCAIYVNAKGKGIDTTEYEVSYQRITQNVESAKDILRTIKTKLAAYGSAGSDTQALRAEALKAQEHLRAAYDEARALLRKLAEQGVDLKSCTALLKDKSYVDTSLIDVSERSDGSLEIEIEHGIETEDQTGTQT